MPFWKKKINLKNTSKYDIVLKKRRKEKERRKKKNGVTQSA
jgi:hypothetical protein